jgi:hypothetical protein
VSFGGTVLEFFPLYTVGILLGRFGVIWVDRVEVAVEEHILEKFGSVGDFILVGLFW